MFIIPSHCPAQKSTLLVHFLKGLCIHSFYICAVWYFQTFNVGQRALPWPGFEPGLLRPQRRVLTTIRSRHVAVVGCVWFSPFMWFKTPSHPKDSISSSAACGFEVCFFVFGAKSLTGKIKRKRNFPLGAARQHPVWHLSGVNVVGYSGSREKKF